MGEEDGVSSPKNSMKRGQYVLYGKFAPDDHMTNGAMNALNFRWSNGHFRINKQLEAGQFLAIQLKADVRAISTSRCTMGCLQVGGFGVEPHKVKHR